MRYDVNGNLVSAFDNGAFRALRYVTDGQGRILQREESKGSRASRTQYYYLNGVRVGEISNDGPSRTDYSQALAKGQASTQPNYSQTIWTASNSADFDQNYEPISPRTAGVATTYTVNSGDTLQIIAQRVWGDSAMWYLIADANGLSNANSLIAGQVLTIPNKITNIHNNSGTNRVYNAAEAQGNLLPTIPDAPPPPAPVSKKKKGGCGGFAGIIVAAITIAVVVITQQYQLIPQALATTLGTTGTAIASAAVSASLGNIAGQVAANAMGVQSGFNFSSLATAALTAGITQGVLGPVDGATAFGAKLAEVVGGSYAAIAARAVVGNVINQGIGNITGSQKGFSWSSVAISGIGAAAGAAISDKLKLSTTNDQGFNKAIGTGFGADLGRASIDAGAFALTQLVVRGGKVNWQQVATDTVTNLIQNRASSARLEKDTKLASQQAEQEAQRAKALQVTLANPQNYIRDSDYVQPDIKDSIAAYGYDKDSILDVGIGTEVNNFFKSNTDKFTNFINGDGFKSNADVQAFDEYINTGKSLFGDKFINEAIKQDLFSRGVAGVAIDLGTGLFEAKLAKEAAISSAYLTEKTVAESLLRESGPLRALEVGTYGELDAVRKYSGSEVKLELDHIPSKAALRIAKEDELGIELTRAEVKNIDKKGIVVAMPREMHLDSRTFAGRNNSLKLVDSADLHVAIKNDLNKFIFNAKAAGYSDYQVMDTVTKVLIQSRQKGLIK